MPLKDSVISERNLVLLMKSLVQVVLRKDMSLNRRLYGWLLGPAESTGDQAAFFDRHARHIVSTAVTELFRPRETGGRQGFAARSPLSGDVEQLPYRVMIGLIDKYEIAQPVLRDTFGEILDSLYAKRGQMSAKLKHISRRFMKILNPTFVWTQLIFLLFQAHENSEMLLGNLLKVMFFLQEYEPSDDETLHVHLPALFLAMLAVAERLVTSDDDDGKDKEEAASLLGEMIVDVFARMPTNIFGRSSSSPSSLGAAPTSDESVLEEEEGEEETLEESLVTSGMTSYDYIYEFYSLGGFGLRRRHTKEDGKDRSGGFGKPKSSSSPLPSEATEQRHSIGLSPISPTFPTLGYTTIGKGKGNAEQGGQQATAMLSPKQLIRRVISLCQAIVAALCHRHLSSTGASDQDHSRRELLVSVYEKLCHLLCRTSLYAVSLFGMSPTVLRNSPSLPDYSEGRKPDWVDMLLRCCYESKLLRVVDISLVTVLECMELGVIARETVEQQLERIVGDCLWDKYLGPRWLHYHQRVSKLICMLNEEWEDNRVEWILESKFITSKGNDGGGGNVFERMAVFWRCVQRQQQQHPKKSEAELQPVPFSRLLLLTLDALNDKAAMGRRQQASRTVVQIMSYSMGYIIEPLVRLLAAESGRCEVNKAEILPEEMYSVRRYATADEFEHTRVLYYLMILNGFVCFAGPQVVRGWLDSQPLSQALLKVVDGLASDKRQPPSYLEGLVRFLLQLALTGPADPFPSPALHPPGYRNGYSYTDSVSSIQITALDIIRSLVTTTGMNDADMEPLFSEVQAKLTKHLLYLLKFGGQALDQLTSHILDTMSAFLNHHHYYNHSGDNHVDPKSSFAVLITSPTFISMFVMAFSVPLHCSLLQKWCELFKACIGRLESMVGGLSSYPANNVLATGFTRFLVPQIRAIIVTIHKYTRFFERFLLCPADSTGLANETDALDEAVADKEWSPDPLLPADIGEDYNIADTLTILLNCLDAALGFCVKKPFELIRLEDNMLYIVSSGAGYTAGSGALASTNEGGGAASIPVLSYVTGIFGVENTPTPPSHVDGGRPSSDFSGAVGSGSHHVGRLSFLPILSTLLETWRVFQLAPISHARSLSMGSGRSSTPLARGSALLTPLATPGANIEAGGRGPASTRDSQFVLRRQIHSSITGLLTHVQKQRPGELIETTCRLWEDEHCQWWADLQRGVGGAGFRFTDSGQLISDDGDGDYLSWDSSLIELIESIPSWTPIRITELLLLRLQRRIQAAAQLESTSSSSVQGSGGTHGYRLAPGSDIGLVRFTELYISLRVGDSGGAGNNANDGGNPDGIASIQGLALSVLRLSCAHAQSLKFLLPFMMRLYTVICLKLARLSRAQSKSSYYSRDMFEAYTELVDQCILIAGRSFDQSSWLRRQLSLANNSGRQRGRSTSSRRGKRSTEFLLLTEVDLIEHILLYLRNPVITQLGMLIPDIDSQMVLATNLMHYLITPALKSHMSGGFNAPADTSATQSHHFMGILDILMSLSQHGSLTKLWRREAWDFFCDPKFFQYQEVISRSALDASGDDADQLYTYHAEMSYLEKWRQLIRALVASDKDKLTELLGRLSTSPMTTLFTNRDQEVLQRALALRRVSFVIWSGDPNQYTMQVPQVQEKLVELMKNSPYHQVQIEIFLALRILLCRVSPNHLGSFWPVLVTELSSMFRSQLTKTRLATDGLATTGQGGGYGYNQINMFLSGCKFLDLLMTLDTPGFIIHQWLFITDTIDALYGGRNSPYALVDVLSSRLLSIPHPSRSMTPNPKRLGLEDVGETPEQQSKLATPEMSAAYVQEVWNR
ncbi:hypothetical protein EV182_001371, partial [Spiromyces aspiralis]